MATQQPRNQPAGRTEQRVCSACGRPATHDDYERRVDTVGRPLRWCCDHAWSLEPALDDGHQCGDEPSDRRPAALAVIGCGMLLGVVLVLSLVWPL